MNKRTWLRELASLMVAASNSATDIDCTLDWKFENPATP